MLPGKVHAELIKQKAIELGFDACGITTPEPLEDERSRLLEWLAQGNHADMGWMENHLEKRLDPSLLVPGSKSVIVVLHNYYFPGAGAGKDNPVISRYARGRDYHKVMKKMLLKLKQFIHDEIHPVEGRAFVDSAPVPERALAKRAGLGWIGKNSMLINRRLGSYVFIGELIIDIELPPDNPHISDFCGTCTRCIDTCPTGAITQPYVVDARKCISWWTIEYKGNEITGHDPEDFQYRIFGCDICQEVCPWNRKAPVSREEEYVPVPDLQKMTLKDWETIGEEEFKTRFGHTPLMRAGFAGIRRNLKFVSGSR
ncbi:MAG: tRNA epoxyqueuosine(34) reductase QueG [Chlorobi bacterium]|nr:tRNA epoxyqueuosine(34) reductase QueG [Chlorobiota bacterium]